jgi:hypothetical protein
MTYLNKSNSIVFCKLCAKSDAANTTTFYHKTLFVFVQNCYIFQPLWVIIRQECVKVSGEHSKFLFWYNWSLPYKLHLLQLCYCIKTHLTTALFIYNVKIFLHVCVVVLLRLNVLHYIWRRVSWEGHIDPHTIHTSEYNRNVRNLLELQKA